MPGSLQDCVDLVMVRRNNGIAEEEEQGLESVARLAGIEEEAFAQFIQGEGDGFVERERGSRLDFGVGV